MILCSKSKASAGKLGVWSGGASLDLVLLEIWVQMARSAKAWFWRDLCPSGEISHTVLKRQSCWLANFFLSDDKWLENFSSQILTQNEIQYTRVIILLSILSDSHSLNIGVTSKGWHLYDRLFCFLSTFPYCNVQQIHSALHNFVINWAGHDQPVNLV